MKARAVICIYFRKTLTRRILEITHFKVDKLSNFFFEHMQQELSEITTLISLEQR